MQALYDLYRTNQEKTLRSWSEVRRIMEREVLPVWRHRRVNVYEFKPQLSRRAQASVRDHGPAEERQG